MANMVHYKHRTNLTSTEFRAFEIIPELLRSITEFIDNIQDNLSSEQPVLTEKLTN